MQAFLDLPNPLNTLTSLQSFSDGIERYIRSLSTLGMDVEAYGALLVPVILNKLPPKTKKNMIRERDGDEWTLKSLKEAIRKEVRVFEAEASTTHPQSPIPQLHSTQMLARQPTPQHDPMQQDNAHVLTARGLTHLQLVVF